MKAEKSLHLAVCRYIAMQFPDVIFTSDPGGLRLSIGMRVQIKRMRSEAGIPDLIIMKTKTTEWKHIYCGLVLELKKNREAYLRKDGRLLDNPHVQNQAKILDRLEREGYFARFAAGFDDAKKIIDYYMGLKDFIQ